MKVRVLTDKLMIFVRKSAGSITNNDPDHFFPIENITMNWNNQSGLLSSFSQYDLFRASCDAGSNLSWNEFKGVCQVSPVNYSAAANSSDGVSKQRALVGSCLVLDMAKTVQLINDFDAPGSIGAYNLQFNVTIRNYSESSFENPELVLITMNSGIMVLENGSSSVLTAILDKQTVLETSEQEPHSYSSFQRQVGSGFLDNLKSIGKSLMPLAKALAPVAREALSRSDNKYAKGADSALKMLGLGASGGAMSGGAMSGGLRRKIH